MRTIVYSGDFQRRLDALQNPKMREAILRKVVTVAVAEAKVRVPRRTGDLGRSIKPGRIDAKGGEVVATMGYAAYVERGTRPHTIVPRRAKVLAWSDNPGAYRLSGRLRTGAKANIFARRVNHPGSRPKPYLVPGASAALRRGGFDDVVTKTWNDAA